MNSLLMFPKIITSRQCKNCMALKKETKIFPEKIKCKSKVEKPLTIEHFN